MVASSFDLHDYRNNGYAVVRDLLDRAELAALRAEADQLCARLARNPGAWGRRVDWEDRHVLEAVRVSDGGKVRKIEPIIDLSEPFLQLAHDPRVTRPVEQIFDDRATLFEDKLNLKLPGGAGFPWHQDWSCCWRSYTDELVTCFLSLDDTTPDNGPLRVLPASHAGRECFPFRLDLNPDDPAYIRNFEVDPACFDPTVAVEPQLHAGDMIVFDCYLLHYSGRNQGSSPRRTIIYTYAPQRVHASYEYDTLIRQRASTVSAELRRRT